LVNRVLNICFFFCFRRAALLARDELAAGNPNLETRFINPLIGAKLNARQDPPAENEPADPPEETEPADQPEETEPADPPEEPEAADPPEEPEPEETEEADQPEETEGGDNEGAASHPVIALTTMASIVLVSSVMILA
jgi:outer membrane biosynthesis protein TonB